MLTYRLGSCILSCLSFVLLLVVEFSPGWAMYLEDPAQPLITGLWTTCGPGGCNNDVIREMNLDVVRSFLLLASFFCLLAIVCSTEWEFWVKCTEDFFPEGPVATIASFLSGLCTLVALIVFDTTVNDMLDPDMEQLSDQWAFFLTWFICGVCFLTGVYSLVIYKLSLWRTPSHLPQVVPVQYTKHRGLKR